MMILLAVPMWFELTLRSAMNINQNVAAASNAPSRVSTWHQEMSEACRRRSQTMVVLAGSVLKGFHLM